MPNTNSNRMIDLHIAEIDEPTSALDLDHQDIDYSYDEDLQS